jgi:hypothetical protein
MERMSAFLAVDAEVVRGEVLKEETKAINL